MKPNDHLFAALEHVRAQTHPELEVDLVRDILSIELQFQDDQAEARQRIRQRIFQWASAQVRSSSSS